MLSEQSDVLIIGAGIAGASIASRYCQLGFSVCLIDEADCPARGTSAHDGAIMHPALGRTAGRLHKIALAAYRMAVEDWSDQWLHRGVFVLSKSSSNLDETASQERLIQLGIGKGLAEYIPREIAKERFEINRAGVWFAGAGSLHLGKACEKRVASCAGMQTIWSKKITGIQRERKSWLVFDQRGELIAKTKVIVLANSFGAQTLLEPFQQNLFLKPVRGQQTIFGVKKDSTLLAALPKINLSGDGYCTPPSFDKIEQQYRWLVGSSYEENQSILIPNRDNDLHNLRMARGLLEPHSIDETQLAVADRFIGIRCVSKDRLPLIGAVPQAQGLYIATALGSRGLLWATLASDVIPALSHSSAFALDRLARLGLDSESLSFLSPARFLAGALASNSKPIFPLGSSAK